jgi:hypothetical protein
MTAYGIECAAAAAGADGRQMARPGEARPPVVYGLWPMVYGLWPVSGLWSMVYGLWPVALSLSICSQPCGRGEAAYGLWPMAYGLWPMAYGLWSLAYGLWSLAIYQTASPRPDHRPDHGPDHGPDHPLLGGERLAVDLAGEARPSVYGLWSMVYDLWSMVNGLWP